MGGHASRRLRRTRLARPAVAAALALAGLAGAGAASAHAASLAVSVAPAAPTYYQQYTVAWKFDATDFPPNSAESHLSDPTRYATVWIVLIEADSAGCGPSGPATEEHGYMGPDDQFVRSYGDAYSDVEGPLRGSGSEKDLDGLPAGDYVLCGYMHDTANGSSTAPEVGPVTHSFTVGAPSFVVGPPASGDGDVEGSEAACTRAERQVRRAQRKHGRAQRKLRAARRQLRSAQKSGAATKAKKRAKKAKRRAGKTRKQLTKARKRERAAGRCERA